MSRAIFDVATQGLTTDTSWTPTTLAFTRADIEAKRDRLIEAGITINVTDVGPMLISGRQQVVSDLLAMTVKILTDPTATFDFRDETGTEYVLGAAQVGQIFSEGEVWISAVRKEAAKRWNADPIVDPESGVWP